MIGATLATSSDPEDLVPGSVAAVRRDADDLDVQAEQIRSVATSIDARLVEGWVGIAADEYAARRTELHELLAAVARVYRFVAEALRAHADVLTWGQAQASAAVEMWARGAAQSRQHAAQPGHLAPLFSSGRAQAQVFSGADAGLATKQQAEALLENARDLARATGRAVAEAFDQVSEGMPDGRWHTESFAAGIGSWVKGIASMARDFSVARVIIDPDGAARSALAVWDAATATYRLVVDDPLGAPDVLLDGQTRRDDPGRWWGQIAPDIVLTAAGGAGLATRAASGARAGMRVEQGVAAAERVTVGRTGFTADELMTPTPGDGPVSFKFEEYWDEARNANALEHIDMLNGARLEGHLSESGRVSTQGELRQLASDAAQAERDRAAQAGTPYQGVAGHVPDTTWSGKPEPPYWQDQDSRVNSSFGAQAGRYPLGYRPTIFEGRLPDGTLVRGSWDWSPE